MTSKEKESDQAQNSSQAGTVARRRKAPTQRKGKVSRTTVRRPRDAKQREHDKIQQEERCKTLRAAKYAPMQFWVHHDERDMVRQLMAPFRAPPIEAIRAKLQGTAAAKAEVVADARDMSQAESGSSQPATTASCDDNQTQFLFQA
jgi:hypothetical protein